jgi:hypothetical protein
MFAPLLKNFFRRLPPPPSPQKFSVSVPFWESKNFSGHSNFFLKTKIFFRKHQRCLLSLSMFIYCNTVNRINLNHDRINLNLVGAPNCRGPLVLELTLTTVRYATGRTCTKRQKCVCVFYVSCIDRVYWTK